MLHDYLAFSLISMKAWHTKDSLLLITLVLLFLGTWEEVNGIHAPFLAMISQSRHTLNAIFPLSPVTP